MRLQDIEAPDLMKTASLVFSVSVELQNHLSRFLDASLEMCRCEDFYFDETLQLAGSIRIEKDSDSAG